MSSNKVIFKRSSVAGKVPEAVSLDYGELALNYADGRLYYKTPENTIDYFETLGDPTKFIKIEKQEHVVTVDGTQEYAIIYTIGYLEVHVNGVLLPSTEYTANNGVTVSIPNLIIGDEVSLSGIKSFIPTIATNYSRTRTVATEGQTTFPVDYSIINTGAIVQVYYNGILLQPTDYTATSGSDIVLSLAATADDVVECIGYKDIQLTTDPTSFTYDSFTGDGTTSAFTVTAYSAAGYSTDVYVDRVYQFPNVDYTLSDDVVTFTSPPDSGSAIVIRTLTASLNLANGGSGGGIVNPEDVAVLVDQAILGLPQKQYTRNTFTGTGSTTNFTLDSTPLSLNSIDVYVGRVYQVPTIDYTLSGNVLTFTSAPPNGADISVRVIANDPNGGLIIDNSDDIPEGVTNLFYTNARARASISATGSLSYNSATGVMSFTMPALTTTNVTEGTNLYYTDARVSSYLTTNSYATQGYVSTAIANLVDSAPTTLDTLNELAAALGDDPNFATTVSNQIGLKANSADLATVATSGSYSDLLNKPTLFSGSYTDLTNKPTTDSITEGSTNLYYTDARVGSYLTTNSYATQSYVGTQIANLVDTAPATLDTLNELAAALGDDPNFATTITNSLAGKQATLVSGTNIKTVNGSSLLGSGNLTIVGFETTDDTTTNATHYPTFVTSAGGSTAKTSSTKLTFNPSTGDLGATNFNSLSDENKKTDIETIINAIELLMHLRGVFFRWKDSGTKSLGLIAQEVETVLPELVTTLPDGTKTVAYGNIVGLLIEAVKNHEERIAALEAKLQ